MKKKVVEITEEQIPELAKYATKSAYKKSLALGNSVLISKNGEIQRVNPDGTTEFVMKSEPTSKMKKGTIITIS
jgi:hypothetical protein